MDMHLKVFNNTKNTHAYSCMETKQCLQYNISMQKLTTYYGVSSLCLHFIAGIPTVSQFGAHTPVVLCCPVSRPPVAPCFCCVSGLAAVWPELFPRFGLLFVLGRRGRHRCVVFLLLIVVSVVYVVVYVVVCVVLCILYVCCLAFIIRKEWMMSKLMIGCWLSLGTRQEVLKKVLVESSGTMAFLSCVHRSLSGPEYSFTSTADIVGLMTCKPWSRGLAARSLKFIACHWTFA